MKVAKIICLDRGPDVLTARIEARVQLHFGKIVVDQFISDEVLRPAEEELAHEELAEQARQSGCLDEMEPEARIYYGGRR